MEIYSESKDIFYFLKEFSQRIKIKLAHAAVKNAPIASLHLFLFQKASFFIFEA
jgi:hypothetical protein